MDDALEEWFIREVLCHEPALTRYIARFRRNFDDIQEIRQEVYIKVLEAADKDRPLTPRNFMFTVAKHLMLDLSRRQRVVPIELLQDAASLDVLVDELCPERRAGGNQQLDKLSNAFDSLPARCREVVWMRKILDTPQKEIAKQLCISEGTVESHLVRGMRLLAQAYHDCEFDERGCIVIGTPCARQEGRHGRH